MNQVPSGLGLRMKQFSQFQSDNCTPSSPRQKNSHLAKSLFTPRTASIRNRVGFDDEEHLSSPNITNNGKDTIKKDASMKGIFMADMNSKGTPKILMNETFLNSKNFSKSDLNALSKNDSAKNQIMLNEDSSKDTPLIFNLPRFKQDYIILEVYILFNFVSLIKYYRNLVMVFLEKSSNV